MRSLEQISVSDAAARVQISKQFFLWLDEPLDWSLPVRRLRLSGWVVAKRGEPLTQIRGRLRGRVFPGRFDRERAEVAQHVGILDAPRWCGFTLDVRVPFGKRRLELQVARADGRWLKAYARDVRGPFIISRAEERLQRALEEAATRTEFPAYIDWPEDWTRPVRQLYIAGWCLGNSGLGVRKVRARVGRRIVMAHYGISRPDVAARFPDAPAAGQSGFAIAAPLSPGTFPLQLELQTPDGKWRCFFHQEVTGANASQQQEEPPLPPGAAWYYGVPLEVPSRFRFWFDRPGNWSARVRHLHISGWCLACEGEEISELRARVRGKTFPAHYGILRPDVAATFETGAAALRSGFFIDVVVPWARSKLVLEARSRGGNWEPFFERALRGPLLFSRRRDEHEAVGRYAEWIRLYDKLTSADNKLIGEQINGFTRQPTFSVLLPVYNPEAKWLRRATNSVRAQLYPRWELCIVDDASTAPHVWKLLESAARQEPRIKLHRRATNGHVVAASNDALALATGEFIALLDHDDELAPTALYCAAWELNRQPDLQLLYSDEDKLDRQGRRCDPYFKSDWNPDLLRSQNYISHLSIYAAALVRKVGGFRIGFEGSQDYDLTLRCVEQIAPEQIRHIPHILYHWRSAEQSTASFAAAKPYAHDAALRAVQEHVDRGATPGRVTPHYADYLRVVYAPPPRRPLISIIIPTRDRVALLRQCLESIRAKTDYENFEIIIVDNESRESETREYLQSCASSGQIEVLHVPGEFNFSKLNNLGVAHARGQFVALLNNDLEVVNPEWLSEMVSHAARPGIGAVGARLWYPDGTLQHGGVLLGIGGVATHAHRLLRKEHGYFARAHLTQNFSAVTAACMCLRKEAYEQAGGLDEVNLPVAFNDIDLCLRLGEAGLRTVWTPHAELIHHESASRGFEDTGRKQQRFLSEVAFMQKRWGHLLEADPYYNPNFSIAIDQQFKLAFPPRMQKPWQLGERIN